MSRHHLLWGAVLRRLSGKNAQPLAPARDESMVKVFGKNAGAEFSIDYPDRKFRLWIYVPTHSKLLLRSGRETSGTTTIDIAFGDVSAVSLPRSMDGFTIQKPDQQAIRAVAAQLGPHLNLDHLLIVRGRQYWGYVVASMVEMDEHDRRFRERDKWGIIPMG